MSARRHRPGLGRLLPLLLAAFLLTGCLEQLSTTRIPAGAARNFFYFLTHDAQDDAMTYWAPDHLPADARAQVRQAATALRAYDAEAQKADTVQQPDGSALITLNGPVARKPAAATGVPQPLLRARLIMIGPGWRLTEFTLLCCSGP